MSSARIAPNILSKGLPYISSSALNPYAPVAKWILGTSTLVAGMVHVGGITRLTKSGLSMTDWKPLGSLPPMNNTEWMTEFDRYKSFPEWQQRKSMTLDEFKYIFYWEWGHRMFGRVVGLCFAVPWGYFAIKGRIPPGYSNRMKLLFAMGGTQGLIGWWMVKSGLGDNR
jgi:cytochrome c oxidase assembly protein subunit 15